MSKKELEKPQECMVCGKEVPKGEWDSVNAAVTGEYISLAGHSACVHRVDRLVVIPNRLRAISREEDIEQLEHILMNPPPSDGRCAVCGRHVSELKPFGGPGDPLDGDFSGELLVMRWRHICRYDEMVKAAEKAWQEAEKSVPDQEDPFSWLISKYGEDEAISIFSSLETHALTVPRWECRDCIGLSDDEYFEAIDKRLNQEQIDSHIQCSGVDD